MNNGVLKRVMIIDGENLLHRSFYKFANLKSGSGKPTGAIFGFLKSINSLIFRFNPETIFVVFDNGKHSTFRTSLIDDYKGNRKKLGVDYESLQNQKRTIIRFLKLLNVSVIFDNKHVNDYEGDDYIALLSKELIDNQYCYKIIIVSSDKDFCQLINNKVKQYNPTKDELISLHNCLKIMGFSANECVDYLCLLGDNSDNIKGYPGMGPKKTRLFLDKYKSINLFLFKSKMETTDKIKLPVKPDLLKEIYDRNKKLIDLSVFLEKNPLSVIPLLNHSYKVNEKSFRKLALKYSMTSICTKEFLFNFKKLYPWKIKVMGLPF